MRRGYNAHVVSMHGPPQPIIYTCIAAAKAATSSMMGAGADF